MKMSVREYFDWRYSKVDFNKYPKDEFYGYLESTVVDNIECFVDDYENYLAFEGTIEEYVSFYNIDLNNF